MSQNPEDLAKQVQQAANNLNQPPLDKWRPELSGDMDLRISRDGQWIHKGQPLGREAIVQLFSTILRREEDGQYYLVTPVEKWRIQVEDTPLLAHSLTVEGSGEQQIIKLTTNVGETLEVGKEHPLEVGSYEDTKQPRPVIGVRHGVVARLVTAAYYDLAEHVVEQTMGGEPVLGVYSHGNFYKIGKGG
ncbi:MULTISPECIES: DUF1285 domain-containing protein [unclassified Marinobacter]|uniref:DUF1285 domain-containing protein n=1 Tax=unclassified Marinobacter TaxID=83889 RepID=UPI0026E4413D|nr:MULTISPECIES: DUF1285 domain-containing protein [unclassified Marinobacter]MDO6442385.1 DUF1285 domain-containing protein [Marinobacter sp. 2_MG-2023]MDO6824441.1 DUF1285 domain-containing protein [Marinobacter sp. 1_MG-2023]